LGLRVRGLSMFVREFAMLLSGRRMVLGLIVLAARVVMLGLMVVMRRRMVVAGCGVMMLLRRVFCHLSVLPLLRIGSNRIDRRTTPTYREWRQHRAIRAFWQWFAELRGQNAGPQAARSILRRLREKTRTSVSGANAAPALFYALTTNVAVL